MGKIRTLIVATTVFYSVAARDHVFQPIRGSYIHELIAHVTSDSVLPETEDVRRLLSFPITNVNALNIIEETPLEAAIKAFAGCIEHKNLHKNAARIEQLNVIVQALLKHPQVNLNTPLFCQSREEMRYQPHQLLLQLREKVTTEKIKADLEGLLLLIAEKAADEPVNGHFKDRLVQDMLFLGFEKGAQYIVAQTALNSIASPLRARL